MGKHKRQRKDNESIPDKSSVDSLATSTEQVFVRQEPNDGTPSIPSAWPVDFFQKSSQAELNSSIPISDIGVQLAKGTIEAMQKKLNKKHKSSTSRIEIKPSPIQLNMWPLLLNSLQQLFLCNETNPDGSHNNAIGIAQTGSGKTLAYCLPLVATCVHKLMNSSCKRSKSFVHGVVLCPTRELAIQVSEETKNVVKVANKMLKKLLEDVSDEKSCNAPRVESLAIYGGVDIESQLTSLGISSDGHSTADHIMQQKSVVIAATPGRLLDILKQLQEKEVSVQFSNIFGNVSMIVFDEADRMALNAEMSGQIEEVLHILDSNGNACVRCLVSATLPQKALVVIDRWVPRRRVVLKIDSVNVGEKKCNTSMNDALTDSDSNIKEESSDANPPPKQRHKLPANLDLATIPSNLVQTLHVCANHKKPKKLITTLKRIYQTGFRSGGNKLCIVFFAQIKTLKFVCTLLRKEGFKCTELFGTLKQEEREQRLLSFKAGKFPILLASDLASRGIHVPNVHYVVNYDFPGSLDQYVHRCGRAGRNQTAKPDSVAASCPPTVFSFFTREFAPMADSVIELLRICNAQVDPNLLALSSQNASTNNRTSASKRKRSKMEKEDQAFTTKNLDVEDHSDEDQFSYLGNKKIVLKRASHISDAEDSDDD